MVLIGMAKVSSIEGKPRCRRQENVKGPGSVRDDSEWVRGNSPGGGKGLVGIVTIQDDTNFGNRLQNFALQQALARLGWQAESIRNTPRRMSTGLVLSRARHAILADGPLVFGRRNAALLRSKLSAGGGGPEPQYARDRKRAIAAFSKDYLMQSDNDYLSVRESEWAERYDIGIVGSDQVWNHGFRNAQAIDFLTFMPPGRRVAYAASFGVHDVPTFLRSRYRAWLEGIPHISVREHRAAEIVADLTGRDVPVVLDPTLLLDRKDWLKVRTRPSGLTESDQPYAVQFFLGNATAKQLAWVAEHAARSGVRLVNLNDLNREEYATLSPTDFVGALGGAKFVATDSFHAGVFALLQHTPVIVRSRDETDSRLHTLFDKQGIERQRAGVAGLSSALDPDWDRADALLEKEREASWAFLEHALESRLAPKEKR